jgi:hypothetical protein
VAQSWTALGFQAALNAIRATGAKNIIGIDGAGYSHAFSGWSTFAPVDTLSPAQIIACPHPYPSGTYPYSDGDVYGLCYPDSGNGTSSWDNFISAVITGGTPVVGTEDGGSYAPSYGTTEGHVAYMTGRVIAKGWAGYLQWDACPVVGPSSSGQNALLTSAGLPTQGQGQVFYNWLTNFAPGLPQFFRMTNQGGSGNTNTSTVEFTWQAATAGANPISGYNIYRGTIVPGAGSPTLSKINSSLITGLTYTDSTATNVIQNNTVAPSTGYVYAITAVDSLSNEGAQQTQVYLYWYYQGTAFQSETNFSYGGLTLNWAATPPVAPPVGTVAISNAYGAAGGFQPVANNAVTPLYGTELGGFNYMLFDCLLTDTTHTWVELNLSRPGYGSGGGGADIQPAGGNTLNLVVNNTSSYGGTPSTSAWVTLKVPLSQMRLGYTTFMGYQSGTTITPVGAVSGVGLDAGGYITGPGVPAGTYVSTAPGSPSGPYTVNNSATVGSAGSPVAMVGIRTGLYKLNFGTNTGGSTWYLNNIGFCVN